MASSEFTTHDVQYNAGEGHSNDQQTDQGFGHNTDNSILIQTQGYEPQAAPQGSGYQKRGFGHPRSHQLAPGVPITSTTGLSLIHFNEALIEVPPYRLPRLDDDNFVEWSQSMERFLRSRRLWGIVDGSLPCPGHPTEAVNWIRYSYFVAGFLMSRATSTQRSYIRLGVDVTPNEIFRTWSQTHLARWKRIPLLNKMLFTTKATAEDSVDNIASAIKRSNAQLGMIDKSVMLDDLWLGVATMNAFIGVRRFKYAIYQLENEDAFSSDRIIQRLKVAEQNTAERTQEVRVSQGTIKHHRKVKCYNCRKIGHIAKDCTE